MSRAESDHLQSTPDLETGQAPMIQMEAIQQLKIELHWAGPGLAGSPGRPLNGPNPPPLLGDLWALIHPGPHSRAHVLA